MATRIFDQQFAAQSGVYRPGAFAAPRGLRPSGARSSVRSPIAKPRDRIMEAARSILRRSGYDGFTIDAVAKHSGLSRRTVYNHFDDRDALYAASRRALLATFEDQLPGRIEAEADQPSALAAFCKQAITALASAEHRELAASAQRDSLSAPWLRELYQARVDRPLQLAIEHHLLMLRGAASAADPVPQARALLAMLKAATPLDETGAAFSPEEIATIFAARLQPARGSRRHCGTAATINR